MMNITSTHRFAAVACLLTLLGAGCSVSLKSQPDNSGVYRSTDQGTTWKQAVFVSQTESKVTTIGGLGITRLEPSPIDSSTIYAVAAEGRLYRSDNKADQWTRLFTGEVRSFAPHPKESQILFITSGNQILQTTDGGQNWQTVYIEGTAEVTMNSVVINQQSPNIMYAGTSRGLLLQSTDAAKHWLLRYTFPGQGIRQLVVNPQDGRILYVITKSGVLWRSADAGESWENLSERIKEVLQIEPGGVRELVMLPNRPDGLFIATTYGLFRSFTGGGLWENLKVVTAPNTAAMSALGVNPQNEQAMYYSADGAFYRTTDGAKTWQTIPLPAPHVATSLVLEAKTGATFYLGFSR